MGIARKIKRKQLLFAKKAFMKEFKKRMREYKDKVQCAYCGYRPLPEENIDEWHMTKKDNSILLKCLNCVDGTEGES